MYKQGYKAVNDRAYFRKVSSVSTRRVPTVGTAIIVWVRLRRALWVLQSSFNTATMILPYTLPVARNPTHGQVMTSYPNPEAPYMVPLWN